MRNIPQLPEEILEVILLRLQVIDLLRSKSVCKRWNFVISRSHFIQLHLKKAISSPSDHRILIQSGDYKYTSIYEDQVKIKDLALPCRSEVSLLSSCDGLISFVNYANNSICLWNPATRASKSLKTIKSLARVLFHWFGHDDDEYKLVIVASSKDGVVGIHVIRLYDDEEDCDSTQLINHEYFCPSTNALGTFSNGRVHWFVFELSTDGVVRWGMLAPTVFSYDLRLKTIEEVALPDDVMHCAQLCVMNGCLSALQTKCRSEECIFEVWMMKEYGAKESWTKSTIFRCGVDIFSFPVPRGVRSLIYLVGITAKGDLVVTDAFGKVVLCNLQESKCKTLMHNIRHVIMYVETLVSPQLSRNN